MKIDTNALTHISKEGSRLVFYIVLNTTEGILYRRYLNMKEYDKSLTNVNTKQV